MKQICLSIDQMKHLEELGLDTSDASPAYILDDILEKFPRVIEYAGYPYCYFCLDHYGQDKWDANYTYDDSDPEQVAETVSDTPLKACYKLLCWLLENGYIKTNKQ